MQPSAPDKPDASGKDSARTGDDTPFALSVLMIVIAGAVIAVSAYTLKKRKSGVE